MDIRKLEVMLPCKLVDCLTGMKQCQQVQLSGRTIAGNTTLLLCEYYDIVLIINKLLITFAIINYYI